MNALVLKCAQDCASKGLDKDAKLYQLSEGDNSLIEFVNSCSSNIEQCHITTVNYIQQLIQQSKSDKSTVKRSIDYKLLESFLYDLIAVLAAPEWPVVENIIGSITRFFINLLESEKIELSLRIISLEFLGNLVNILVKIHNGTTKENDIDFAITDENLVSYKRLFEDVYIGDTVCNKSF